MQPNPHVAQDQGHTHVQQAQQRITRAGPDACLLHLPVTGLDAKPTPVGFLDPLVRSWLQPASVGVYQGLASVLAPFPPWVAALDTDSERGSLSLATGHRISPPATLLPRSKHSTGTGSPRVVHLAATQHQRHQERIAGALQVADHLDRTEAPVQQQVTRPDSGFGCLAEQLGNDLVEG